MNDWTEGPWRVSLPNETQVVGPNNEHVATTFLSCEDYDVNYYRRANDARLISAARCLYEACRAVLEWSDRVKDGAVDLDARRGLYDAAFQKARAALAKAEGRDHE